MLLVVLCHVPHKFSMKDGDGYLARKATMKKTDAYILHKATVMA
jgi:hypothetical protein